MNFTQIRCFWTVATTGSFSEAAEQLFLSQPAVSKSIISLERELGIRLLNRNGRYFSVSQEGRAMLRHYTEMLNIYDQSMATVRALKNEDTDQVKTLRLTGNAILSRYGVIYSLRRFIQETNNVTLLINECEENSVRYSLQAGDCDLAFCTDIGLSPTVFDWQIYYEESFSAIVALHSPLAAMKRISFAGLKNQKLILGLRESRLYDICVNACNQSGFGPVVVLTTSNPGTAIEFVLERDDHAYIALSTVAPYYAGPGTKIIPFSDSPSFRFVMAWKKATRQPEHVKKYLDFINRYTPQHFIRTSLQRRLQGQVYQMMKNH